MNELNTIDRELDGMIQAIHGKFQYDFRNYSRSSLRRRALQAVVKLHCRDIRELTERILTGAGIFPLVLGYLMVNTTEFFRDAGYFKSLIDNVFPYLKTFPSLKIWVAGCSTGEEVLSLTILMEEAGIKRYMLYATDINPMNLESAKRGTYSLLSVQKANGPYLESGGLGSLSNYYTRDRDKARFDPLLLKKIVFADHSLATDNVFSEMHFISCRNVLIYFERPLQDRAFGLFDESLVRDGFLGLGTKETIQFSPARSNFKDVDPSYRIYQKVRAHGKN